MGSIRVPCGKPRPRVHVIPRRAHTDIASNSASVIIPGIALEDRRCDTGFPPLHRDSDHPNDSAVPARRVLIYNHHDSLRVCAIVLLNTGSPSPRAGTILGLPSSIYGTASPKAQAAAIAHITTPSPAGDVVSQQAGVDLTAENDDTDASRVPPTIIPTSRLPRLDRTAIIAVFEHTFRPKKDLIKLRSPEFKASLLDTKCFDLKLISIGLQFYKVVSVKD